MTFFICERGPFMSQRSSRLASLLFCTLFFLIASTLYAQSDAGSVVGFVKDASGGFVPGAKMTLKNETTGVERGTNTNEAGYYVFTSVPPGFYSLSAEAKGFKKYEATHNKLDPN